MVHRILDVIRQRRMELLLILFIDAIYFFSYFQRVAVPGTIFDELQSELRLSSSSVAMLGGIFLYVYGSVQIICGMAIDRFGAARSAVFGGVLLCVGSVLFPLSGSLPLLYATRALVGLGGSLAYLTVLKATDTTFSGRNFSLMLSTSLLFGYAGGLYGTYPFARAVGSHGWRNAMLGVAVATTIVLIGLVLVARKAPSNGNSSTAGAVLPALRGILRNPRSYPPAIAVPFSFSVVFLVQAIIGKKMLEDICDVSPEKAAGYTFMMMLSAMISTGFYGFVSRIAHNRRKPVGLTGVSMVLAGTLVVLAALNYRLSCEWFLVGYLMLGAGTGVSPIYASSIRELNWENAAATSVGVLNSVSYLAVAINTTAAGLVLDHYAPQAVVTQNALRYPMEAYRLIFTGALVIALIAFIAALLVRETHGRNLWRPE